MKYILIFSSPYLYGHTLPLLHLTKQLIQSGYKVFFYASPNFQSRVISTGATYLPYPNLDSIIDLIRLPTTNKLDGLKKRVQLNNWFIHQLENDITTHNPDCLLFDDYGALCGNYFSRKLGIPSICSITKFAYNLSVFQQYKPIFMSEIIKDNFDHFFQEVNILAHQYSFSFDEVVHLLSSSSSFNIVYTSKDFQLCGDTFDESFHFVGPALEFDALDISEKANEKVIYISLGTLVNNNLYFFQLCIQAFQCTDFHVIISVGDKIDIDNLCPISDNIEIHRNVNQLEILSKSSLFISHGGMNSITESICYQVPTIIFPQKGDQFFVAKRMEELGAATVVTNTISPNELLHLANKTIHSSSIRNHLLKIKKSFSETENIADVVQQIQHYIDCTKKRTSF